MRKLAYFAAIALLCTGIAVAQSTSSPDQSSTPSAQQPSNSSPSSTPSDQASPSQASPSSDQNQQAAPSSTSDQSGQAGATTSDQAGSDKAGKKLPQTASPLPFLSLLGMGMLGAGGLGRIRDYFRK